MIPEVRFCTGVLSTFYPKVYSRSVIEITLAYSWKDIIAMTVHELVHLFQWYFVYKKDVEKWNSNEKKQEKQANRAQDFIYYTLLRGKQK